MNWLVHWLDYVQQTEMIKRGPALRQVRIEENKLPDFLVIYNTFLGQYSDSRGELIISVSCTYM